MTENNPFSLKNALILQTIWISCVLALCSLDCQSYDIGDGWCDLSCMNQGCNFDGGDCEFYCSDTIGCALESNGICDSSCNSAYCGFDHGDCGYCSDGCTIEFLQDTICHPECNNYLCNFNNYVCECNPGCQHSMLGDGICDWSCMNYYCQYDGGDCWDSTCSPGCTGNLLTNYVCDEECNTSSCLYDNGDCLCAPGCYPDLLENSNCDSVCAFKSCNYDNHLCGDCAINCYNSMINNGICNSECNNEACGFDGNDCLSCAPGCLLSEIGKCKPECIVLDCDFDPGCVNSFTAMNSYYAQLAVRNWNYPVNTPNSCYENHGCKLDYTQYSYFCDSTCNNEDCFYDYFQCWGMSCTNSNCWLCLTENTDMCLFCMSGLQLWGLCVDSCPRYYTAYYDATASANICIPVTDTSTEELQDESFVSAEKVNQGDGSIDFPYNSLSYGLSRLAWKCSVIYLMAGIHNLTLVYDKTYLFDATASRPLYQESRKLLHVTVKPLYCSIYNHTGCVKDNEKVTVVVDTNPITLDILSNVTFENIIFDGSTKLSPYCSDCDYCKKTTTSNGITTDDHGNTLDSNSYVPQSTCDQFQSTNFIEIGKNGILNLKNVEIINFRQQYNSIINLNGGILNMNSVDFYNIMVKPQSGVILSNACSSNYCGKIYFINSSLSLLNNGYEIFDAIDLSGFMVLNKIILLEIENSTIQYNLVNNIDTDSSIKTTFTLNQILNLTILDSKFQYNFNYDGIFYINQYQLDMPSDIDEKKNLIYENLINIRIENSLFKNNSAFTTSGLLIQYNKDFQNILINNCTFLNNFSEDSGIISISYKGNLIQEFISGDTRVITLSSGQKLKANFPAKNITLKDSNFTKNSFGMSSIFLTNLPNLYILNTTWDSNGDNLNEDINTSTINYLKSLDNIYINSSVQSTSWYCNSILSISRSNNFIFERNTITKNYCISNNAGLSLSSCTNKTLIQNSIFSENQASGYSVALIASMSSELILKNLIFIDNYFYNDIGYSVISLSSPNSIPSAALTNCSFIGGELAISTNSVELLILENCTMDSISDSFYSTLVFFGKDSMKSTAIVKNCTIKNNNPNIGHIWISTNEMKSRVLVNISDIVAYNNFGGKNIISIDKAVDLDPSSHISHSNFIGNNITAIYARMQFGILSIDSCIFDSNFADYTTVLYLDHPAPAETHFSNSKIISNRGNNIFYINGNSDTTNLFTSNLYFYNNTNNAIIANGKWIDEYSYFYQNSAVKGGSVIIKDESVVNLEGTIFKENLATSDGGAIYVSGASNITCNNCTIANNTSNNDGGGLAIEQNSIFSFNNSIFTHNKCDLRGSAISILNSKISYSYLINTEISNNYAGSFASILSDTSHFSLQNCSVFNNAGITNSGIFMIYSACNISESSFSNHTGETGSDISINIDSSLFIYNTKFHNSHASSSGGSISVTDGSLICEKCNFINTKSPTGSTLQCASKSSCMVINSSILDSYASSSGGILFIFDSTLSMNNTKIQDYQGSAIKSVSSQSTEMFNSTFQNGFTSSGTALICIDCQAVTIIGTNFKNLGSYAGGAILFDHSTDNLLSSIANIEHSIFENCRSFYGGSIYSNNVNININYSTFINNSATDLVENGPCTEGEGGALFLTSTSQVNITIQNSTFSNNKACLSGGAVQWYLSQPVISNSSFSNNLALYGNNLASFALNLKVLSYQRRLSVEVPSVPGQYIPSPIIVGIIDHYNQTVLTENSSSCKLEVADSTKYSLSGKIKVQASSGIYNFSEVIVSGDPGSEVGFTFSSSIVASTLADNSLYFKLRECDVGEASVSKSCQVCDSGTYNLVAGEACKDCPMSAKCYGKNIIYPKPGYWRINNLTDNFFKCPNSDSCLGGISTNNSNGACREGYYGNLCQSCMEGYSRNGDDVCSKCPNITKNALILFGMGALAIFIVVVMTRSSFKLAHKSQSLTSVYIKIFMNYLQLVVITSSFNFNWPQLVLHLFLVQNYAGSMTDQIFSVDCFLQGQKSKTFFSKLIFMTLLPLLLAIITILFWAVYYLFTKNKAYFKNKFMGSLVVQLFLIQPSLVKYNFSTFNCIELTPGSYYLRSSLDIKCWDREHSLYAAAVAFPSILIWCIAVPSLCLLYIHSRRALLNTIELKLQFGFLYLGFKDRTYYWEFANLYRKILVICCSVFIGSVSTQIQALTVFFLILSFFFLHRHILPYRTGQLNSLETKSILVSGITIYCGLYYLTEELAYSTRIILFIIIVSVNVFFMIQWISSMTGIGLWFLYSKFRWCRMLIHGTKMETWFKSFSFIDINIKEAELDKGAVSMDIQKGEDLKNWRKLKAKQINNSPEISIDRSSAEYESCIEKNSVRILKEEDEPPLFLLVPHPTLNDPECEVDK